jgi:hypothetical protein
MSKQAPFSESRGALTGLEGRIGLRDVPGHSGEQRDAMLRSGDGVGRGRVDDEAPVLCGGGEIDVVDPDSRAAHHTQPPAGGLEDVAPDLGPGAHDERVAEGDLGAELLGGEPVGAVDVGELPQQPEPRGAELLGDEDGGLPRHGAGGGSVRGGGRRHRGGDARALRVGPREEREAEDGRAASRGGGLGEEAVLLGGGGGGRVRRCHGRVEGSGVYGEGELSSDPVSV